MLLSSIAVQLSSREMIPPAVAYAWAWRIENEYPDELRQAAELWAENNPLPTVEVTGITLDQILEQTGVSIPAAIDILYVLSKSPADGRMILTRCARRD